MDTESLAALFKSLSEPVRLRIMALLLQASRDLCVCDLVEALQLPQSVVSRHLAYLRHHQLVSNRREKTWIYYQPAPDCCQPLFEFLRDNIKNNKQMQQDLARLGSVDIS